MAETVSEITVAMEEDGELLIEELEKVVLTKGPWSTILFRYRERNRQTKEFGPPKATVRRYQKFKGAYRKRDAVNLTLASSKHLIEVLSLWIDQGLLGDQSGREDESEE
ncbi:MAG: hypothetical protein LBK52_05255 [Deltaproteobacteria bacterium]|jgi:hypothetical protein|nr:hypothetical protein [Deltaproteobacteria bacterium]